MSSRAARRLTAVFFVAQFLLVTYPGIVPFNRIRPLVFGLPFSLVWVASWVVLSGFVLVWLYRLEHRAAEES